MIICCWRSGFGAGTGGGGYGGIGTCGKGGGGGTDLLDDDDMTRWPES